MTRLAIFIPIILLISCSSPSQLLSQGMIYPGMSKSSFREVMLFNLDVNDDLIPEFIDITVNGALFGSGIIAFDEFEHSGIFKESQHKQDF